VNADDILDALADWHGPGGWALLREAWSIDALAVPLVRQDTRATRWKTARTPFPWVAYEVKVDRDDMAAELARWPEKAARAIEMADAFVFAVPAGMLREVEKMMAGPKRGPGAADARLWIPPGVGLVEVAEGPFRGEVSVEVVPAWGARRELTAGEHAKLLDYCVQEGMRRGR
jgi:hypothetical protein